MLKAMLVLVLAAACWPVAPAISDTEAPHAATRTGAYKVVDSLGQLIGYYDSDGRDRVSMRLLGRDFMLPVGPSGFLNHDSDYSKFQFFHLTSDCSGARYVEGNSTAFFEYTERINANSLYATKTVLPCTNTGSYETFPPGADLSQPGICTPTPNNCYDIGLLATVPLSRFVPPFKIAPVTVP